MLPMTISELIELFRAAGFYYRHDREGDKIMVGPNIHGTVPDMEFDTQEEARAFLRGWNCCIAQIESRGLKNIMPKLTKSKG